MNLVQRNPLVRLDAWRMKMAKTTNFADVIREHMVGDHDLAVAVENELLDSYIATHVFSARTAAGMSQGRLADLAAHGP